MFCQPRTEKKSNTKIKSVLLSCKSAIKNEQEKFTLICFKASLSDSPRHCELLKQPGLQSAPQVPYNAPSKFSKALYLEYLLIRVQCGHKVLPNQNFPLTLGPEPNPIDFCGRISINLNGH